jgi:hypothetical protein
VTHFLIWTRTAPTAPGVFQKIEASHSGLKQQMLFAQGNEKKFFLAPSASLEVKDSDVTVIKGKIESFP